MSCPAPRPSHCLPCHAAGGTAASPAATTPAGTPPAGPAHTCAVPEELLCPGSPLAPPRFPLPASCRVPGRGARRMLGVRVLSSPCFQAAMNPTEMNPLLFCFLCLPPCSLPSLSLSPSCCGRIQMCVFPITGILCCFSAFWEAQAVPRSMRAAWERAARAGHRALAKGQQWSLVPRWGDGWHRDISALRPCPRQAQDRGEALQICQAGRQRCVHRKAPRSHAVTVFPLASAAAALAAAGLVAAAGAACAGTVRAPGRKKSARQSTAWCEWPRDTSVTSPAEGHSGGIGGTGRIGGRGAPRSDGALVLHQELAVP